MALWHGPEAQAQSGDRIDESITVGYINDVDTRRAEELIDQGEVEEGKKLYNEILSRASTDPAIKADIESKLQAIDKPEVKTFDGFKVYNTKFKDVIGLAEQKDFIRKTIGLPMKYAEEYKKMDMNSNTGMILYGPPGVGKTMLIEALSGEYAVRMIDIKVGEVLSKYIGEPEKKIIELFSSAKEAAPSIMFFDEIDVLAQSRDSGGEGYGAELKSITASFLKEMTNIAKDDTAQVFMIGATNMPWDIDDAMKRGGRFEHLLYVRPPGLLERRRLFKKYLGTRKNNDYIGRINYFLAALATIGYSPADIEKLCKMAKTARIAEMDKKNRRTLLLNRHLKKVLNDRQAARNSLDEWYLKMKLKYIGPQRYRHKDLLYSIFIKKSLGDREAIGKPPIWGKEELAVYREMVEDVNRYMSRRAVLGMLRWIGKVL